MTRALLTRDQVLACERPAWVEEQSRQYFYDGVSLWEGTATATEILPENAPHAGWHHQRDCECAFCRRH